MPRVLNKYRHGIPPDAVFIGRPGKWGNPFIIGRDGNRAQVVAKYSAWLAGQPELLLQARRELHGRDLVCFCAPLQCHGDVLLEIANSPEQAALIGRLVKN